MTNRKKLICVTGLPGAGKSVFCEIGKRLNFKIIIMGNQIRKEVENRGLNNNSEILSKLMIELREKRGKNAIAEMCKDEIIKSNEKNIIIDGIRNIEEIELFKEIGEVKIILIKNTKEQRMKFLQERNRSDAPMNLDEFNARDKKELEVGLEEVMNISDIIIDNINLTKEEFEKKSELILNKFCE
ncbi:MAG: dephospho-CoA kinase [Thaumarchaeota archaeon]|nr:dephospho-CoA kinase [Nitrososphaerota archaeon]|tara:strand:+ start:8584 stop:9138 length:555 start_codon:yes stop_codon:yes gene_type:complete